MNATTCIAKAAELKTSAVTNWLVDWLFAPSISDLRVVSGERKGRGRRGLALERPLWEGKEESGETSTNRRV